MDDVINEELQAQLKTTRENRDQFLRERDIARQLAYDLYSFIVTGAPYPYDALKKVELARGIGGYERPR